MRFPKLLSAVLLVLMTGFVSAQPAEGARLSSVVVEGTTTFADIVRVVLTSRAGTAVEDVDLEAERNRVYALGSFASVSLSFDQHGT
ncbi:MAG TPA: hypothetical protein VK092_02745, partial [Deinococcales bacterium]|nr:hypothetical protein [Deinococcales bacterium]